MWGWWKRRRFEERVETCGTCGRVNRLDAPCGTLKREHQDFGDGGWVEFRSWNPCSPYAPGGVVVRTGPLLDEAGDLDDVRGLTSSETVETVR